MVLEFCELGSLETLLIRKKVPLEDEEVGGSVNSVGILLRSSAGVISVVFLSYFVHHSFAVVPRFALTDFGLFFLSFIHYSCINP